DTGVLCAEGRPFPCTGDAGVPRSGSREGGMAIPCSGVRVNPAPGCRAGSLSPAPAGRRAGQPGEPRKQPGEPRPPGTDRPSAPAGPGR
ncbi:unnamed protein product, partial [Coccothraustes coccothraustes]